MTIMKLKHTLPIFCLTHPVQTTHYVICYLYLVCILLTWQMISRSEKS